MDETTENQLLDGFAALWALLFHSQHTNNNNNDKATNLSIDCSMNDTLHGF